MEIHQKDIQEKDPFGQNRADEAEADEADEADDDEKSFLKALLAEQALKKRIVSTFLGMFLLKCPSAATVWSCPFFVGFVEYFTGTFRRKIQWPFRIVVLV